MTIRTRIRKLLDPYGAIQKELKSRNPNDLIFISTVKPVDKWSIEELEQYLEARKRCAEAVKLLDTIDDSVEKLKELGYDIHVKINL